MKKGFAPIVIVLLVIALIAIGAAAWYWKNQSSLVSHTSTSKMEAQQGYLPPEEVTKKLDPQINLVVTGGEWGDQETYGNYRVLVIRTGFEETQDHMYFQTLQINPLAHTVNIIKTVPIKELEKENTIIEDMHFVRDTNTFEGRLNQTSITEGTFSLAILSSSTYNFKIEDY